MPDTKEQTPLSKIQNQDYLVVEALIKLAAIERLLIKSGAIKPEELINEIKAISAEIVKNVADTAAKQQLAKDAENFLKA
jgi:hypothetical protein